MKHLTENNKLSQNSQTIYLKVCIFSKYNACFCTSPLFPQVALSKISRISLVLLKVSPY